ncbi:MAG: protein-methionine-sulfoxide reductase heme-binding subunit MsrQ [Boseongicola sp. SB0676_bin_33]|nr:protein-methionine-sulfoxide reductase heme-binding subunit MsrQ [Boseongicola sp. SB0676_bin_33]MYK31596.1 protein-methionine-sulfoxide reductase heme-binding subunit MsrQ [Boseongicola sp. SB0670_bin_30]
MPGQGLGQVSVVKPVNRAIGLVPPLAIYVLAVLPPAWFLWQALTGRLGVEPIKALEHELGELALQVLIATLAVRPVNKWTGINFLKLRRAFGVVTFFYVLLHLLVWLVLDVQFLDQIWADIVKRPYITVGMGAFALMIPLALTSNNLSLRKLGPVRWRRLHRLMYPVVLLGAIHFVMLSKGFQLEPYVYLGVILALLATRIKWAELRAA